MNITDWMIEITRGNEKLRILIKPADLSGQFRLQPGKIITHWRALREVLRLLAKNGYKIRVIACEDVYCGTLVEEMGGENDR